jgi:predicted HTH transcriptional regulator
MQKIPITLNDGISVSIIRVDIKKSIFVHQSPGGYFCRIGSSKRQMSPEVLSRLFQQRTQLALFPFDENAVPFAPIEILDKELWKKFLTPLSPTNDDEFLRKTRLITTDDYGVTRPTVAGLLVACHAPEEFLPNAYIQAVAYRGQERNAAYQLDARDITGPLDEQVRGAYKFVKNNMKIYATKNPARVDIPQYSLQAIFEAVVNAVAHRDYTISGSKIRLHLFSDRIELYSPGSIPNSLDVDSLHLRQFTRYNTLTSLLARCPILLSDYTGDRNFLMDKRGEGVPIILTESSKLAGTPPVYRLIDNAELLLTIFAAKPPKIVDMVL